jgi:hypothetical protein
MKQKQNFRLKLSSTGSFQNVITHFYITYNQTKGASGRLIISQFKITRSNLMTTSSYLLTGLSRLLVPALVLTLVTWLPLSLNYFAPLPTNCRLAILTNCLLTHHL